MTSVLVQAVVITDMLVLNGWHLLPSLLNAAGNCGGRHSSAFLPQEFRKPGHCWQSFHPKTSGHTYFPTQEGRAHLPSAPMHTGEPNRLLLTHCRGALTFASTTMCISHSWREKKPGGLNVGTAAGHIRAAESHSSMPSERDTSRKHISYTHNRENWSI